MNSVKEAEDTYKQYEPRIIEDVNNLNHIIEQSGEKLEGNCFYFNNSFRTSWFFLYKRINYINVIKQHNIKKMIEIGLNGGHSASVFLSVLPEDGSITFFDLVEHNYVKPCYTYLKNKYPQVSGLIEGDSTKTLLNWMTEHMSDVGTYDCVHVDGGHSQEVSSSDMNLAHYLLKPGGIMILDDTQYEYIAGYIPFLINNKGYKFIYQIPT